VTTKRHPEKILSHLTRHGDITPMEAWNVYGCYRLSSVIQRLRKKGHAIGTRMKADDAGKNYAQYYMVRNAYLQTSVETGHEDTPFSGSVMRGDLVQTSDNSPLNGRLGRVTKLADTEYPVEVLPLGETESKISCPLRADEVVEHA